MYRVCFVKCWFVDGLFIIIKLHPSPYLMHDGHDSEDTKQSTADMTAFVQNLLQQMVGFFNPHFFRSCNHSFNRINELEQSINDLRAEMGVEGTPTPASKSGDEPKTPAS
uniref:Heat shock factor binding protein n=1 Tax=Brassica campestris TaxID=3711 RepID=M4D8F3_BRACM